jgi:gluconate 5-dehydrogenase
MGATIAITARHERELQSARDRQPDTVRQMVGAVLSSCASIDILVNNAGTSWGAPAESHPFDQWRNVVDVNLTGTWLVTQEVAVQSMIPRRYGRIINIASIAGLHGSPPSVLRAAAYHASKGGVVNLTRALAAEWGQYGIVVNAVCPGFIPTKMSRGLLNTVAARVVEGTPLGRLGAEEDVQGISVLLASSAARHITGQVIAVDGGATAV